jgi:hypothetical protein
MRPYPVLGLMLAALALGATPASAKVLITVDKSAQQMNVSVDGVHRWTWLVSTGIPRYDTPSGSYRAFRMEADHFSKEWDDAPMPHSIFFTPQGHAIHGYLNTRNIGSPASHGCVRLNPAHAAQLYALVQQQGVLNTTVVLTGDVRVAVARKGTQTAARNAGVEAARLGPPTELQPDGVTRIYGAAARPGYDQPSYGYQQPQYETRRPRAEYGRTYDNCPPPPPGFPTPSCAYNAQARAEQYPPRRYDYGQPQYEPDPPRYERRGFPFGGY